MNIAKLFGAALLFASTFASNIALAQDDGKGQKNGLPEIIQFEEEMLTGCADREIDECLAGGNVRTIPAGNSYSSAAILVPKGASYFVATLANYSDENCVNTGEWRGEVYVGGGEGGLAFKRDMKGIRSSLVVIKLPKQAQLIELRAVDTNATATCDDPVWREMRFLRRSKP